MGKSLELTNSKIINKIRNIKVREGESQVPKIRAIEHLYENNKCWRDSKRAGSILLQNLKKSQ